MTEQEKKDVLELIRENSTCVGCPLFMKCQGLYNPYCYRLAKKLEKELKIKK